MAYVAITNPQTAASEPVIQELLRQIKDNFINHETRMLALESSLAAVPAGIILPYGYSVAPTGYLTCDGSAVSRTTYATLFAIIGTTFGAGDGSTTFNVPDARGRTLVGSGTMSWSKTFTMDFTNNWITVAATNDIYTGDIVRVSTTTTLPSPLAAATDYYAIRISDTQFRLATSLANAVAGTEIDVTDAGTGTHTVTRTLTARTLGDQIGQEFHALTVAELPVHTHIQDAHSHTAGSTTTTNLSAGGTAASLAGNTGNTTATNQNTGSSNSHNNIQPSLVSHYIIKT